MSAFGPSRHVATRSLTVAFGGLCCKTIFSLCAKNIFPEANPSAEIYSQNRPFGFYYCRFSLIGYPHRDFCNTIGAKRISTNVGLAVLVENDLGCVKTCARDDRAELFSLLSSPHSIRQRRWFSN